MSQVLFFIFAIVAIAAAIIMIVHKNPVYSVLSFILTLLAFAGFYILLSAPFVAGVHVVFYSGVIMVVFLYSVAQFGMKKEKGDEQPRLKGSAIAGIITSVILCVLLFLFISSGVKSDAPIANLTVESPGELLIAKYMFPFSVTLILLFSAILGSVFLIAKNKLKA